MELKKEKKYYWLKLKDDFFKQKELKKLRNIAGGDTYTIIYLKMQLLSLKNKGKLIFDELEDTFAEELALELDENVDNIKITLAFLRRSKLIEEVTASEFMLPEAIKNMGSETDAAERMRRFRANKESVTSLNGSEQQCNMVTNQCNLVTQTEEQDIDLRNKSISPIVPFSDFNPKAITEQLEKQKQLSGGSFQTWQFLATQQEAEFTSAEWDAVRGLAMKHPHLPPHTITTMMIRLHAWGQQGLNIEDAILEYAELSPGRYNKLKQPFMAKLTDAKGNPIYGIAIAEHRKRIIEQEKGAKNERHN